MKLIEAGAVGPLETLLNRNPRYRSCVREEPEACDGYEMHLTALELGYPEIINLLSAKQIKPSSLNHHQETALHEFVGDDALKRVIADERGWSPPPPLPAEVSSAAKALIRNEPEILTLEDRLGRTPAELAAMHSATQRWFRLVVSAP